MRALFACLLCLAAAAPASAAARAVPPVRGVTIGALQGDRPLEAIDADLAQVRALGANTVRLEVSWAALEGARGVYVKGYLQRLDHLVSTAARMRIKPLLLLLRTPCWATSQAPDCRFSSDYPPDSPADYASIAGRLAARYRGRLAAIEVWNEPDHSSEYYFRGPDKPRRYAAILKAAYASIKRADPRLPVLGGSLVGADGRFLEALYAEGIAGHYDGLAVHYYDLTLASLRSIRQVQARHGDRAGLWLTEFGWPSCYPAQGTEGEHACVTAKQQASDLGDVFRALGGHSFVRAAVVYNLRDRPNEHLGVLDVRGRRKPAFAVMRRAMRTGLGGPRAPSARRSGDRVSGRSPAGDIVTVQGFSGGRFVYQANLVADRFGRFSVSIPAAVRGARLVVGQPWTRRSRPVSG